MADMTASVPELRKRNLSINGIRSKINFANSLSFLVGAPKLAPFCNVSTTD
jgi:hypothetical protein